MTNVSTLDKTNLSQIKYIFTDVDDTLTTKGKLLPETINAMMALQSKGFVIVPVTGACAGWCDQIIRLWPVDAVIGENGAFVMSVNESSQLTVDFWEDKVVMEQRQSELLDLIKKFICAHPTLNLTQDQHYRLCDVAINYRQDNAEVSLDLVNELIVHLEKHNAQAKMSSIHVNAWIGNYNKAKMVDRVLKTQYHLDDNAIKHQSCYIGDAPNDEPMFETFFHTFGVSNIKPHLSSMTHHPKTILNHEGGLGFEEFSQLLLKQNNTQ